MISDRHLFLGIEANVLLRIFYYNLLGAIFEALLQRTGGYTNLLISLDIILKCSFIK